MAKVIDVKITGLNEIVLSMKKLPGNIQKNILTSGVRAAAAMIAKEAKNRVVVKTGNLKNAISVIKSRTKDPGHVKFRIGILRNKIRTKRVAGSSSIKNKTNVFYGHLVEFGTRHSTAKPFMRPAFASKGQAAIDMVTKKIKSRLNSEIRKVRIK